jgi:hypothetical protein
MIKCGAKSQQQIDHLGTITTQSKVTTARVFTMHWLKGTCAKQGCVAT